MNRTKRTMAVAISQILSVLIQSVFALFSTRAIIANVGSDYNGLTSTATQILTFLTLIEGGYTLASLVKLYEPYNNSDDVLVSKYLTKSKINFKRIGILYLIVGIAISLAYTPFVKTNATFFETFIIMFLTVASSSFSIYYVTKFRILFQVSQSEYIVYFIQAGSYIVMYSLEIILVNIFKSIIVVRLCVAIIQILQGVVIGVVAKRKFKNINYNEDCDGIEITGTADVFVSRVCGLVYNSAPVFFISTFVGTTITSIYSVYTSVISIISNVVNSFLNAPRNALGQMAHSSDNEKLESVFNEYEFLSIYISCLLSSVTLALIIPFVRIYTRSIADVDYIDSYLALLIVINVVFQMVHIPSGTCLEVTGRFKVTKIIQGIAALLIAVSSIIGAIAYGIYGILAAKLLTSLFLCVAEISYVRKKILQNSFFSFFKIATPTFVVSIILAALEFGYFYGKTINIITFVIYGLCLVLLNTIALTGVNFICNKNLLCNSLKRIKVILKI